MYVASRPVYYDLYDCGHYDGRYRAAELMVMLGIRHRQQIEHYSDIGILYQKRYLIVRVDDESVDEVIEKIVQATSDLKRAGRDLSRIRFVRIKNPHDPRKIGVRRSKRPEMPL